jgi:glycosyltransferase involved in cell wall biosynthesis
MSHWTILTCEYPPRCGGVGDYTAQLAAALVAAGDEVTVVCPPRADPSAPAATGAGIEVVVLDDTYGRAGRRILDRMLDERARGSDSSMLVQYVPTGFGLRGANIPFCRWLLARSQKPTSDIRIMFHEPYFEYTWSPLRQNALAAAERVMARTLLRAASRVYLSTDAWRRYLAPHAPNGRADEFLALPIPSAIPKCNDADSVTRRRRQLLGSSTQLIGHFGTFGSQIVPMLTEALVTLLDRRRDLSAVCIGHGSDEFVRSVMEANPAVRGRVHGTGRLEALDTAASIAACDLMLQPYIDGVTTRRTSTMAGLINRRPIVTTTGHLTEPIWQETAAVALGPDLESLVASAIGLLDSANDRDRLAERGERLYNQRFSLMQTVRCLRGVAEGAAV